MAGYVKLFGSILDSTIWHESSDTRVVWITMLAMADRDGVIEASVPGLAKRAGVTREACEVALDVFQRPDPDSRTPDHDGRRVAPIAGGWHLLNYERYREKANADEQRSKAAERQARHRERHKRDGVTQEVTLSNAPLRPVTPSNDIQKQSQRAEADPPIGPPRGGAQTGLALTPPEPPPDTNGRREIPAHIRPGAERILALLNAARKRVIKGAHELRPTHENLRYIAGRLHKGATEDECAHVIAVREAEVRGGGPTLYFDAITPFRPDNFAKALAQTIDAAMVSGADMDADRRRAEAQARFEAEARREAGL